MRELLLWELLLRELLLRELLLRELLLRELLLRELLLRELLLWKRDGLGGAYHSVQHAASLHRTIAWPPIGAELLHIARIADRSETNILRQRRAKTTVTETKPGKENISPNRIEHHLGPSVDSFLALGA
ncbi:MULTISPECIES: hypothetical protein [unclassified Mesorhizobium]|uniref:hypothetical protein n=1 Tax=unclassified Mesorhizobium TaxID=325217 RepID=UPI0015E2B6A1|nr:MULTISPECIES: hypothetical protein [unclassified Mesorhizobium]MCA0056830.1 hypothetical protein [Mesorhizobium sp. B261B1A]